MSEITDLIAEARASGCTHAPMPIEEVEALVDTRGWLFFNPDTGTEWSEDHPHESGEVPDAENVRPATAAALQEQLIEAWQGISEEHASKAEAIAHLVGERDAAIARAEKAEAELAKLSDPAAVRINLLRGTIARPAGLYFAEDANGPLAEALAKLSEAEVLLRQAGQALDPFDDVLGEDTDGERDDERVTASWGSCRDYSLTVGDLRRARTLCRRIDEALPSETAASKGAGQ